MKKYIFIGIAVAAVVGLVIFANTIEPKKSSLSKMDSSFDKVGEAEEGSILDELKAPAAHKVPEELLVAIEKVKEYDYDMKQETIAWFEHQISEIDKEIAEMKEAAKAGNEAALEALKEKRAAAVDGIYKLSESAEDGWKDAKSGMVSVFEALKKALEDATGKSSS